LSKPLARDLDQIVLPFDPDHLAGDAADYRGGVSRPGADLEHLVAQADTRRLDHQPDDVGLRDRLPRLDRQRVIAVREMRIFRAHERLARHVEKCIEDHFLGDPAPLQLTLDHRLALAGRVCHGCCHGPPPDRDETGDKGGPFR
jgi:hypothetical protein